MVQNLRGHISGGGYEWERIYEIKKKYFNEHHELFQEFNVRTYKMQISFAYNL